MKKILICYRSRYGTTEEVVEEMKKAATEAGAAVDVVNLKDGTPQQSLTDYDLVIVGSGIQAGRWAKEPLRFLDENSELLSGRDVALFVVCGDAANPELCEQAQHSYLDEVAAKFPEITPISTGLFAGMFDFKRYNFVTKALIKKIIKSRAPEGEDIPEVMDFRDWDRIRGWITELAK